MRHVSDEVPGFRRERRGTQFCYRRSDGRLVRDPAQLARIARLAIPPAWTDVWICPSPDGHLQATGRDARRRKQYRYHENWRVTRDRTKFAHLHDFARALPRLRRRVARDLRGPPLARSTVLATVVRLLDTTLIRIGNEEYARDNHSYGLATLRHHHVAVGREKLRFHFRGKGGREHRVEITDRRVAAVVRRLQDLPGQELFQYIDDTGRRVDIGSAEVNAYLREAGGADITAKDFRTWAATLEAARLLNLAVGSGRRRTKTQLATVIAAVAARLGNTPAICRKCYVHPALVDAYLAGAALNFAPLTDRKGQAALLRFLRASQAADAAAHPASPANRRPALLRWRRAARGALVDHENASPARRRRHARARPVRLRPGRDSSHRTPARRSPHP